MAPTARRRRTRSALALAVTSVLAAQLLGANASALTPTAPGLAPAAAPTRCDPPSNARTVAQRASVSASATAGWNSLASVTDGVAVYSGGASEQTWGTYSDDRPASQWLQYQWSGDATLTGAAVAFWHDNDSATAGDGVAVPRAWRLQSWDGTTWHDVALKGGAAYPRSATSLNEVTFAAPVVTSRLRAVLEATTDGTTYAAVAVSDLAVSGEAPDLPGASTEVVSSGAFNLAVSRATGGIYHLSNPTDTPSCTNYVANPTLHPDFDVDSSRWTGDVGLTVDGKTQLTGLSDDTRTVRRSGDTVTVGYDGDAANPQGIRGLGLTETYAVTGDAGKALDWSIDLDNTSGKTVEVQDLTLPMLMNSWWNGGDQTGIYEQNVGRHSFVAEDGSYAYWQRPNGVGPFLVMVPDRGTSLEFRDKARTDEGVFGEADPSWEGLIELAVHSKALQPARKGKIEGNLPATSLTLAPGASKTYGFTFRWASSYADLHDVLYDAGVVDAVSLPGMVIPKDQTATLAVRAKDGIDDVTGQDGQGVSVTPAGRRNGYSLYRLSFSRLGQQTVTVTYGGGRTSVLQYNAIAPVEQLIEEHAQFLVDHQQAKGTGHGYEGAFLQWDMSRQKQVSWFDYPGGGWKQWLAGGSDDLGLSPAVFLSQANVQRPEQAQVSALDYYLKNFIWDYMQTQTDDKGERTYRVYHWYDGTDGNGPETEDGRATWRVMNYPHVWNTYLNMYRIAKAYPSITTELGADEYLMRAYNTMRAYFLHPNVGTLDDASREMGSMGEMTMPDVIDALRADGHAPQADELEGYLRKKADAMLSRDYPFASEMSIDTTAFEATYTLAKRYGDTAMANKVTLASLAARGQQPLWYYYGSDNRHMGESWWNMSYETQLGAWQQQDYLRSYDPKAAGVDFDSAMRSTYGAYLAGWSNINAGQISDAPANLGAASWQYQSQGGAGEGSWDFMPMLKGWWAWSGEADLGFWGGLQTASTNVVDDGIVGLYAYGGDVSLSDGRYTITPHDGVRTRFTMFEHGGFGVEVGGAKYTRAEVQDDLSDVRLALENVTGTTSSPSVTLHELPAGTYQVSVDGAAAGQVVSDGTTAVVRLTDLSAAGHEVRVSKAAGATGVEPTLSSSVRPNADGWYAAPVEVAFSAADGVGVQYRLDDGAWTRYDGTPLEVRTQGVTTITYRGLVAGVPSGEDKTLGVKVDSVAPSTSAEVTPASGTVAQGRTITARFTATDATSGVERTEHAVDGGAWTPGAGVALTEVGSHVVRYRSVDRAGNVEAAHEVTLTVADAPTAKVTITAADAPSADGWYRQPVVVALRAPRPGQQVQFRLGDGRWTTYRSSITVRRTGETRIAHRVLAGKKVVAGSRAETLVKVDRVAPKSTARRAAGLSHGTPRNPLGLTFAATDRHSGVAAVEYRVNGGRWTAYEGVPLVLSEVGDYVISHRARDEAGNVSRVRSLTASIDPDPATTATVDRSRVKPGATLTLSLAGFRRWDDVQVRYGSGSATVVTDREGRAKARIRVASTTPAGPLTITATGTGGTTAVTRVTVR